MGHSDKIGFLLCAGNEGPEVSEDQCLCRELPSGFGCRLPASQWSYWEAIRTSSVLQFSLLT